MAGGLVRPEDNIRSGKSKGIIGCRSGREKVPHANGGAGKKVGTSSGRKGPPVIG